MSRGGLLFLSPVMYPKYKCSISQDEDDDDDDDHDDFLNCVPGGHYFCPQ